MRRVGKYSRRNKVRSAKFEANKYVLWFKSLKLWQKVAVILGPIVLVLILIPLATYIYFARDISDKERLMNRNNTGVVLQDVNGKTFYSSGRSEREEVKLDQISDWTKKALISSEDKNFYKHGAFSITSMLGALYGNVVTGGKSFGGSTITQQLAKNTLLTNQKSYLRKYQELSIAVAIERTYSKDEILEMYLNSVYYGEEAFGIKEAAKTYFNKEPADLDLAESAMLIGLLPAPSAYSPISGDIKLANERQKTVLGRMLNNGVINKEQEQQAISEQLNVQPRKVVEQNSPAPHFAQMVIQKLNDEYGEEKVSRSGFKVKTTLDLDMQKTLQDNIDASINRVRANGGSNASGVAIDPKTGEVKALVGSYSWDDENFGKVNMTTATRQPGSSFKPIYYSDALEKGVITPATILNDAPTDFNGYKPQNAMRNFNGDVTVRKAINWSLNIPAVKVMKKLGISEAIDFAKNAGITTFKDDKNYGLALALGASEAKLTELTNVYAGFANAGDQHPIKLIESVTSKYGDILKRKDEKSKRIISEGGAYLISNILSDNQARAGMFGSTLTVGNKKVAVKTGTTDDNRDAWTIGYTPDIALGIWVGNNDNSPMSNGGGIMAGPIWRGSMLSYTANQSAGDPFYKPSSIIERSVCYGTGKLAHGSGPNTYTDVFLSGKLPGYGCEAKQSKSEKPDKDKKEDKKTDESAKDTDNNSNKKSNQSSSGSSSNADSDVSISPDNDIGNSDNGSSPNESESSGGSSGANNSTGSSGAGSESGEAVDSGKPSDTNIDTTGGN